jgi:hypothetical protein
MDVYRNENELFEDLKRIYGMDYDGRPQIRDISFDEWFDEYQSRLIVGTKEQCLEKIHNLMDLGVTYFIFKSVRQMVNYTRWRESLQNFSKEIMSNFN